MARLLNLGFELNSVTTGVETAVTNNPTIVTTPVFNGSYALKTNPDNATATDIRPFVATADTANILYTAFRFMYDTLPGGATDIVLVRNNATAAMSRVRIDTAGALNLRNSSNAQVGSTVSLLPNVWYRIEIMNDATTNPGALELRVNGVSIASGANVAQGQWQSLRIGNVTASNAGFYFDNLICNDNTGSFENTWVGDQRLAFCYPTGAGDSNQFLNTAAGAGDAGNYALVNEQPPNDATTMVQSGTLNNVDMYSFSNPIPQISPTDTITCVTINARTRNNVADATTAAKLQVEKTTSGTILQSVAIIPNSITWLTNNAAGTAYMPPPIIAHQDPDAANWTLATVCSMQAGIKITAANVNRIQMSAIWAYVSYTPATTTRTVAGARSLASIRSLP